MQSREGKSEREMLLEGQPRTYTRPVDRTQHLALDDIKQLFMKDVKLEGQYKPFACRWMDLRAKIAELQGNYKEAEECYSTALEGWREALRNSQDIPSAESLRRVRSIGHGGEPLQSLEIWFSELEIWALQDLIYEAGESVRKIKAQIWKPHMADQWSRLGTNELEGTGEDWGDQGTGETWWVEQAGANALQPPGPYIRRGYVSMLVRDTRKS